MSTLARAKKKDVPSKQNKGLTYLNAGVKNNDEFKLESMLDWINKTYDFRKDIGKAALPLGYFANVIDIGMGLGVAISTDGVGTKILVAEMLGKFDTIGIDCIAMNVNDVICVGAEPTTMVDYIAVEEARSEVLVEIAKGLYEGAKISQINIPAGEIAQIPEMIKGARKGHGLDLVGTCIGLVPLNKIIIGQNLKAGDVVIGLKSSGIHSNGLTLARKALLDIGGFKLNSYVEELGKTLGEELLEPTRIYVSEVMGLINSGINIKALVHITSDGFLNLTRVESKVGYVIDELPGPNPIFKLIQEAGNIDDAEMFRVFNMGIGFCAVIDSSDADQAIRILREQNIEAMKIGYATDDARRRVHISPYKLMGEGSTFVKA